jgi:SAM-dependent methyltransferase
MTDTKQKVREFYDEIGWQQEADGNYQNARYEDLRPVSAEYIHKTRLRVNDGLIPTGKFLLDAGSGPVQYDDYLTYSKGYEKRVCLDISIQALKEARERIGKHGMFVVADVAHLPFKNDAFDGIVSMHTIHHLPVEEHKSAYIELYRVLNRGRKAAIVNGWGDALLVNLVRPFIRFAKAIRFTLRGKKFNVWQKNPELAAEDEPVGTFVNKTSAAWLRKQLAGKIPLEITAWRSVNVHFLRTFIHPRLGGRLFLKILYWLERTFPRFYGENGQYPLIIFHKPKD